jgi:hypothetical protein
MTTTNKPEPKPNTRYLKQGMSKGDFAAGEHTLPPSMDTGDFASGEHTLPPSTETGDFASGEHELPVAPAIVKDKK